MYKQFTVINYTKSHNQAGRQELEPLFSHYHEAWEYMNEMCMDLNEMPAPRMPKVENPLRQDGRNYIVELWVITRIVNN
jgi:hypothetical protein